MYNFLKMYMEVAYNTDIPRSSCICEVCKNTLLLAKGINSSLNSSDTLSSIAHDLVETHTCNLSSKDYCFETPQNVYNRDYCSKQMFI